MKGMTVPVWLDQTVEHIRRFTDRPIVVRGHPGDKSVGSYLRSNNQYSVSTNEHILDDFKNAWAVVTYNSTPGVAASIEGIPAFVTDPLPQTSQAYDVATCDLSKLETPNLKERQLWIERLAMCHWHFGELESGAAWQHMRNFV
jgi:hypothetical protein